MVLKSRISSQRLYSWVVWLKATSLPFKHPIFSLATNYSLRCKLTCTCAADTRAESRSGKNVYTSCGLMPASKTISLKQSRWGGCEQAVWWGPSIQVLGQGLDCVSPLLSHPFSADPQTDHTVSHFSSLLRQVPTTQKSLPLPLPCPGIAFSLWVCPTSFIHSPTGTMADTKLNT